MPFVDCNLVRWVRSSDDVLRQGGDRLKKIALSSSNEPMKIEMAALVA